MSTSVTKKIVSSANDNPVKLTKELMNQYRESLISRRCEKQTISMYFCYLNRLYSFLQGEKELTDDNIKQWIKSLKDKGYSDRTINLHISSVNGLLRFCGHKSVPISVISVPKSNVSPELTRDEYVKLLSYAKKYQTKRNYLLIKTLATIDINVTNLSQLTVEACQKGVIEFSDCHQAIIPDSFRQELLSYIYEEGISSGSVFLTSCGNQPDRSNITHLIEQCGSEVGIDRRKSNPRALHALYERTQQEITQRLLDLHMREYERLLTAEDKMIS